MIKYLLTFVLVGLFYQVQCQKKIVKISGLVEDAETGELIGFASVGVQGRPISTVTNLSGEFSLNIPMTLKIDSITISSL